MTSRMLCPALLAALLLAAACSDEQPVQTEETPTGEGVVGRGGGALESADGKLRIEFPLGAVAEDVRFKIAPAVNAPAGAGLAYVVTPTDVQLLQRARLLFRYADSDISGLSEERLRVSTVDAGQWRVSDSPFLDTDSNQAAGYSRVLATVGLVQAGCLEQSECTAPEVCSGFTCQLVACDVSVDCGAGLACVSGVCLLLNACGSDDDCLLGEFCADIVCLPRADCSVADGCSDGEHCVEGRCTRSVDCQIAADCGEGFACRATSATTRSPAAQTTSVWATASAASMGFAQSSSA